MGITGENRAPANSTAEAARDLERLQNLLRRRHGNAIDNGDVDESLYMVNEESVDE